MKKHCSLYKCYGEGLQSQVPDTLEGQGVSRLDHLRD